jgi:hypothetical protein
MTAHTLLDNALALILTSSSQTPEYTDHALPVINMLLAETEGYNNMIRIHKGKGEKTGLVILSMEDELPCEQELALSALPNGLCSKLLMDDDDLAKVAYFQNQYAAACEMAAMCVSHAVTDVYTNGAGA